MTLDKKKIYEHLKTFIDEKDILIDESMKKHTYFHIGGNADIFVTPSNISIFISLIRFLKKNPIPYYIIGNGTKLLVSDEGFRGIVISTRKLNNYCIDINDSTVISAESGISLKRLSEIALDNDLSGIEFASGIPGTLGAAVAINANAFGGSIQDMILETEYFDETGEIKKISVGEHDFRYKHSIFYDSDKIILNSRIKLKKAYRKDIEEKLISFKKKREQTQPMEQKSAGSIFKRKEGIYIGKLIEHLGLKGYKIGGAAISEKHSGFIINEGNATASDVILLIEHVKTLFKKEFDVDLEEEIFLLGDFSYVDRAKKIFFNENYPAENFVIKDKYIIGKNSNIRGSVSCGSAKNFVTKAMIFTLLSDDKSTIYFTNLTDDIRITVDMMRSIGASIIIEKNAIIIDPSTIDSNVIKQSSIGSNRLSILLITALMKRFDHVTGPLLDGCQIGARGLDMHIDSLKRFGIILNTDETLLLEKRISLKSTSVELSYPSVGVTENCLIASIITGGTSILRNIAIEPEILELIKMLRQMGVQIEFLSEREISIHAPKKLNGVSINSIGDRIEATFFATLALATNLQIKVENIYPEYMKNFLKIFKEIGGDYELVGENTILFKSTGKIYPCKISTEPYPGISTDMQQCLGVLLTQAKGTSLIHETVFENRLDYIKQLGLDNKICDLSNVCYGSKCRFTNKYTHTLEIKGPGIIQSKSFNITNLREGFAFIIAAMLSEKDLETIEITNIQKIERAYPLTYAKLLSLGVNITKN